MGNRVTQFQVGGESHGLHDRQAEPQLFVLRNVGRQFSEPWALVPDYAVQFNITGTAFGPEKKTDFS